MAALSFISSAGQDLSPAFPGLLNKQLRPCPSEPMGLYGDKALTMTVISWLISAVISASHVSSPCSVNCSPHISLVPLSWGWTEALFCCLPPGSDLTPRRSPKPADGLEAHTLCPALAILVPFLSRSQLSSLLSTTILLTRHILSKQGFQSFLSSSVSPRSERVESYLSPHVSSLACTQMCRTVTFY